jgi:hypothetical protein
VSHDLGQHPDYPRANVLLSGDFRYFGVAGTNEYKSRFPRVARAVERLGRGARVRHNEELRRELLEMADWLWRTKRKVIGKPTSAPSRQTCLRGGVSSTHRFSEGCLAVWRGGGKGVRRRYVRFWRAPDMAHYPPRLIYDANDPTATSAAPNANALDAGFSPYQSTRFSR